MAGDIARDRARRSGARVPDTPARTADPAELREGERALRLWESRAAQYGMPPPLRAFDLAQMLLDDWAHRFLISADAIVENHAFLIYGSNFARLLGLPERPVPLVPMMPQLPPHYRGVFAKGCSEAVAEQMPVRLSGILDLGDGRRDAYRVTFAPIRTQPSSLTQLVYGAFNRRLLRALRPA
jgi:hypothetical protein